MDEIKFIVNVCEYLSIQDFSPNAIKTITEKFESLRRQTFDK